MIDLIQLWLISGTVIGQILLMLIGYTILNFLPKNNYFTPFQKFAFSYGLGTGFLSFSMFIFILLGVHARLSFIPILIIITILFIKYRVFKKLRTDLHKIILSFKNIKFNRIEFVCIIFIIVELIFIFLYWLIYPVHSWDATCIWDAKAKFLFFEGNLDFLSWYMPHPDYPLLVPLNLTFYYSIYFQYHYFSKILFVFFFIFLILAIYSSLRFFKLNRTYSILISTLIASVSDIFLHATIAYADLALTFFYTISIILLFYYFKTKKIVFVIYSALFMGFMAWTKMEGLGLLFVNFGLVLIYNTFMLFKREIDFKKYITSIATIPIIAFMIYLPWFLTCIAYDFSSNYIANFKQIYDIEQSFLDLKIIFNYMSNLSFLFSIFWILFLLILILNIKSITKQEIFFLFLLIIFHFFLYIGIYIISPYNLEWHLKTSFNREILHITPICGFFIGIVLLNKDVNKINFGKKSNYIIIGSSTLVSILIFIILYN